jgi:hypothetical protein
MTDNNEEKVQQKINNYNNYLARGLRLGGNRLLYYQLDFLERFNSGWERNSSQEEKLALIKRFLKENEEKKLEHTSFPPYCPTEFQSLLQEWLIVQLKAEFQVQIQQSN